MREDDSGEVEQVDCCQVGNQVESQTQEVEEADGLRPGGGQAPGWWQRRGRGRKGGESAVGGGRAPSGRKLCLLKPGCRTNLQADPPTDLEEEKLDMKARFY